jgi:NAD(P)-dependent dehydrogenase (short-subunit alcohol dehydrogenase family)
MILQDKVALVTGGTSGIGRATVIAYAQQQAKVVVVGRRMDEGEETVRLIQEAGAEAIFVQADVTKEADVKAMVDKTVDVCRQRLCRRADQDDCPRSLWIR